VSATWRDVLEGALRAADAAPVADPGFTGGPGEFLTWCGRTLGVEVESDAHLRQLRTARRGQAEYRWRRASENAVGVLDSTFARGQRSLAERPHLAPGVVPLAGLARGFSGAWAIAWPTADTPSEHPVHRLPAGARVKLSVAVPWGTTSADAIIVSRPGAQPGGWVTATGAERLASEFIAERDARAKAEAERRAESERQEAERQRAVELSRPVTAGDLERLRHELAAARGA
jgi:hypothetical protein